MLNIAKLPIFKVIPMFLEYLIININSSMNKQKLNLKEYAVKYSKRETRYSSLALSDTYITK